MHARALIYQSPLPIPFLPLAALIPYLRLAHPPQLALPTIKVSRGSTYLPQCLVMASRNNSIAVGADGDAMHPARVPFQGAPALASAHVPHPAAHHMPREVNMARIKE